jgi:protoporphyrin/coproporphyrin ferrochelatase
MSDATSLTVGYDAILVVGFGGPYGPDDVLPFLENVTRGRGVPRERLLEVAGHYHHFGGASPINEQTQALVEALRAELEAHGPRIPVYLGNRNWHPLLGDTVKQMAADGVKRALAVATSAWSSYSSCRQYLENIAGACAGLCDEAGAAAVQIDKVRVFGTEPGFIAAMAERVADALVQLPGAEVIFTAHSIPQSMARSSRYEEQLRAASAEVAARAGAVGWRMAWQSRSGPPTVPWLEPDISEVLQQTAAERPGARLVIAPIGFLSDHMEVLYDLDYEAQERCNELDLAMVRAATVGTHPAFIGLLGELIRKRAAAFEEGTPLEWPDVCPADCCPAPVRPAARG